MIPKWMQAIYLYHLSGELDLQAKNLEVYEDNEGNRWIQPRNVHSCLDECPSLQEFLDGLQDS